MTFRPYPPPLTEDQIEKAVQAAIPKKEWAPEFPGYAQLFLTVQVFKDYGNGWLDVCDDDGNCLRVSKKNLRKAFFEYFNTESNMKSKKDAVLKVAKDLLKANNTITTLEIKMELRRDYGYYYWTQQEVSDFMNQFAGDGIFTYVDNGKFRIYSLASPATVAATAGPVSSSLAGPTKVIGKVKRGRPRKTTIPGASGYVVNRTKVGILAKDVAFESFVIDGKTITKSDIRAQKKSPYGYLTNKKIDSMDAITVSGITYHVV